MSGEGFATGLVTCKVVKRYYYRGKGYASLKLACRVKAKRMLVEMVLGPYVEASSGFSEDPVHFELENAWPKESIDRKSHVDCRFAEFFPHEGGKLYPGCMDKQVLDARCRTTGGNDPEEGYACDFVFESCKQAQELWLKDMTEQLMLAYRGGE